jgi:hypothetical protein
MPIIVAEMPCHFFDINTNRLNYFPIEQTAIMVMRARHLVQKHDGLGVLAQFAPVSKLLLSANAMIGNTFDSNIALENEGFFI